ncbi:MAG: hypothetical protein HY376_03125 [Candidatus Blackburnbacteria bacterium]|nr:hypothetical protein [Candidatus Blackburnbacteria bacterium]
MAKNTKTQFRKPYIDYLNKNWQPLGLGVIVGFILRELLIVAILAVAVVAIMVVLKMNQKHTKGGKA